VAKERTWTDGGQVWELVLKEGSGGYIQRRCEGVDVIERHVPFAPLDPSDVVSVEASELGKGFLGEPSLRAEFPDPLTEGPAVLLGAFPCASHGSNVGTGR
jgi:hypothetical protein